jgi:hypothetical protein
MYRDLSKSREERASIWIDPIELNARGNGYGFSMRIDRGGGIAGQALGRVLNFSSRLMVSFFEGPEQVLEAYGDRFL